MKHCLSGPADYAILDGSVIFSTVSGIPATLSKEVECPVDKRAEVVFICKVNSTGANAVVEIPDITIKGSREDTPNWTGAVAIEQLDPKKLFIHTFPANASIICFAVKLRPTFKWNLVEIEFVNKDGLITGFDVVSYVNVYEQNDVDCGCAEIDSNGNYVAPDFWRPTVEFKVASQKMGW